MSVREYFADDLTDTVERTKKPTCLAECKPGDVVGLEGVRYVVSRPSYAGRKVWVRRILDGGREGEVEYRDPGLPVVSIRARP